MALGPCTACAAPGCVGRAEALPPHTPFWGWGCEWLRSHPGLRVLQPGDMCVPAGMSPLLLSDEGSSRDVVPSTLDVLASSPAGNRNLESIVQQLGECSPPSGRGITTAPPGWKGSGVSTGAGTPGAVLAWLRGHPMVSRELRSGGAVPPRGAPPGSGGAHAGEEPVLVCSG